MEKVKLIEATIDYEKELIEYIREFQETGETIHGGADIQYKKNIEEWLQANENNKREETVEKNLMPASSFILIRENDKKLLGLLNIRHKLNDFLYRRGGHIGYSIKTTEREKGYGYEILRLALAEAKKLGLDRVLVTCDENNMASRKIIEKNKGVLENIVSIGEEELRRYWIEVK